MAPAPPLQRATPSWMSTARGMASSAVLAAAKAVEVHRGGEAAFGREAQRAALGMPRRVRARRPVRGIGEQPEAQPVGIHQQTSGATGTATASASANGIGQRAEIARARLRPVRRRRPAPRAARAAASPRAPATAWDRRCCAAAGATPAPCSPSARLEQVDAADFEDARPRARSRPRLRARARRGRAASRRRRCRPAAAATAAASAPRARRRASRRGRVLRECVTVVARPSGTYSQPIT